MQLKVGLKATSHVREKFLGKVFATYDLFAIKPLLSYIFANSRFSHSRKNDEFSRLILNFQESSWISWWISEFNDRNFRKIWKTRVPPASPLPYLVYEGMSHTFDHVILRFSIIIWTTQFVVKDFHNNVYKQLHVGYQSLPLELDGNSRHYWIWK